MRVIHPPYTKISCKPESLSDLTFLNKYPIFETAFFDKVVSSQNDLGQSFVFVQVLKVGRKLTHHPHSNYQKVILKEKSDAFKWDIIALLKKC